VVERGWILGLWVGAGKTPNIESVVFLRDAVRRISFLVSYISYKFLGPFAMLSSFSSVVSTYFNTSSFSVSRDLELVDLCASLRLFCLTNSPPRLLLFSR